MLYNNKILIYDLIKISYIGNFHTILGLSSIFYVALLLEGATGKCPPEPEVLVWSAGRQKCHWDFYEINSVSFRKWRHVISWPKSNTVHFIHEIIFNLTNMSVEGAEPEKAEVRLRRSRTSTSRSRPSTPKSSGRNESPRARRPDSATGSPSSSPARGK